MLTAKPKHSKVNLGARCTDVIASVYCPSGKLKCGAYVAQCHTD